MAQKTFFRMKAYLGLASGEIFRGEAICYDPETEGEVVLYSSARFPHQLLTDPAHHGRIIVSDAVSIENRWPHFTEIESYAPHLRALVMLGNLTKSRFESKYYNLVNYLASNMITLFRPDQPLLLKSALSAKQPIGGIISRGSPALKAIHKSSRHKKIDHRDKRNARWQDGSRSRPPDPVRSMSTSLDFYWDLPDQNERFDSQKRFVLVAYDYGISYSTLRNLKKMGCDIRIVPADFSPGELIALNPEGILLGGGPGDPTMMDYAISNIARLIGLRPILATRLGHFLLGLSMGAKLHRLSQPHFGYDIPVDFLYGPGRGSHRYLTNQAHLVGFDRESLITSGFEITMTNADDGSVEGYSSDEFLIQSYAFSLGREDEFTESCLKSFIACMEIHRAGRRMI